MKQVALAIGRGIAFVAIEYIRKFVFAAFITAIAFAVIVVAMLLTGAR